jgi:uncharacterized protein YceH (UPF0502 family)
VVVRAGGGGGGFDAAVVGAACAGAAAVGAALCAETRWCGLLLRFVFGLCFGFAAVVVDVVAGVAADVLLVCEDEVEEDAPQPASTIATSPQARIAGVRGWAMCTQRRLRARLLPHYPRAVHFSELTPPEQRVLGCLIEKRWTTPDQYPLSLNALRLACNQSTNRDPVTRYDESTVREAAQRLSKYGLARLASGHGSRATKYRHLAEEALGLGREELAVLAVLLLRGPQTPGELKARTDRMAPLESLADVERVLALLAERDFVRRLDRRPGQKEDRFEHLLGGGEDAAAPAAIAHVAPAAANAHLAPAAAHAHVAPAADLAPAPLAPAAPAPTSAPTTAADRLQARVEALEAEVAALREDLAALRADLGSAV